MMKWSATVITSFFYLFAFAQVERGQVDVLLDYQTMQDIQFADLDNDGDLDFVGNRRGYKGHILVYFNQDGMGTYAPPVIYGDTSWHNYPDIYMNFDLGDMDNDGDIDLVPGRIAEAALPYWTNDGNGTFELANIDYSSDDIIRDYHFFKVADLDNDGHQDVVIFRSGNRSLYINRNLGDGLMFEDSELYDAFDDFSPNYVSDFFLFDYDLDGDLDVGFLSAVRNDETGVPDRLQLSIYEQTSSLCFEEKTQMIIATAEKYMFNSFAKTTDLDGDGFPDILVQFMKNDDPEGQIDKDYLLLLNNELGSGTFTAASLEEDISDFALTDYDQDGDVDLFTIHEEDGDASSSGDQSYRWKENEGDFNFLTHPVDDAYSGNEVFAVDINQDNRVDLVTLHGAYPGLTMVRFSNEDLSFTEPQALNLAFRHIWKIHADDWDQDGDTDVFFNGMVNLQESFNGGIYRIDQNQDGSYSYPQEMYGLPSPGDPKVFHDLNNDGRIDAIGMESVLGTVQNRKLVYTLQEADGSWTAGTNISFDLPEAPDQFVVADWDGDDDLDIIVDDFNDHLYFLNNDLNNSGQFSLEDIELELPVPNYYDHSIHTADFDLDGRADLLASIRDHLIWAKGLEGHLEFAPWDTINTPSGFTFTNAHIADFNADGHADVLLNMARSQGGWMQGISFFDPVAGNFLAVHPLHNGIQYAGYSTVADFNSDGLPDYLGPEGFRINQDHGRLFSAPFVPAPLEHGIPQNFHVNATVSPLTVDVAPKAIVGLYEIMAYDLAFLQSSTLEGFVRWDTTGQCVTDSLHPSLSDWHVRIDGPENDQLALTNYEGRYGALLPVEGSYEIAVRPPSGYWAACPADTLIQVVDNESLHTADFAAIALVDCPLMVIEMNSTSISQCFGSTVSIGYYNAGTAGAENVVVKLQHDPRLIPVGSSLPWSSATDSCLVFEIPIVDIGENGHISIQFEPECADLIPGEEICFEASVTPNELCDDMVLNWDGANLEANVLCDDTASAFQITNTGDGATSMPVAYQLSIINDDIILYLEGDVILSPGEADTIPLPEGDQQWYLSLNQTVGHPYPQPIGLFTQGCGVPDSSRAHSHLLPMGSGNPFQVTLCREVVGPYDPNSKSAIPLGLTDAHYIERDWSIDYTIQFQNIGTDRARTVVLEDSLSVLLDMSTFTPLAASHDFEWRITDGRLLRVTFPEINLPDSTSNEIGSHGFFSFRITPEQDAPFEADIYNFADIYFDFNAPIRTETTQHRLRKPIHSGSQLVELCAGEEWFGQTILTDTVLRETMIFVEYDSVTFFHITVLPNPQTIVAVSLAEPGLWQGIPIEQDTMILLHFQAENGCDSLVFYQIDILTNNDELATQAALQMHPNPASASTLISWGEEQVPVNIQLYNSLGQIVRVIPIAHNSKTYRLPTDNLASGSYQVLFSFTDGICWKRLKITH